MISLSYLDFPKSIEIVILPTTRLCSFQVIEHSFISSRPLSLFIHLAQPSKNTKGISSREKTKTNINKEEKANFVEAYGGEDKLKEALEYKVSNISN